MNVCNICVLGKFASTLSVNEKELPHLKSLHLITSKPMLYVLNKKSGSKNLDSETSTGRQLLDYFKEQSAQFVIVDASTEHDLNELDKEDRDEMKTEIGLSGQGIDALIQKGYEILDLVTFFTHELANEPAVAGGKIHHAIVFGPPL